MILLILLQSQSFTWPPGWTIIGWVVAAIIALIYLYSGVIQNVSSGRKDLIEVGEKKLTTVTKEKEVLEYKIKQLEENIEALEKDKLEIEKENIMLMREHHQLLEISVADLKTLKTNAKLIEQLEGEINRYREEKGLPPKAVSTLIIRE
jgi:hypothetical protein